MYFIGTLYYLYKKEKRESLIIYSKKIAEEQKKPRIWIIFDMIMCSLINGALFSEYYDMDFVNRTRKNRKTYITTLYDLKLYDKINNKGYRHIFHDKIKFNETFAPYIKRQWINASEASPDDIINFAKKHSKLMLKGRYGDSGAQVCMYKLDSDESLCELIPYIKEKKYDIIEEVLINHEKLQYFNETSLNTIRIVTVNNNGKPDVLTAVLRVGAKGSYVDNMCQGGSSARIDLETGKLDSPFYAYKTKRCNNTNDFNAVGYQIPMWEEVKRLVVNAAKVIPQIGIVSWDVAITPDEPVLVEENESFGASVLQLYYNHEEDGLKPRLLSLLGEKI